MVGFPGVADAVCQYAGPEFSEDFEEADESEVFNAGEFFRFGEWYYPPLLSVVRDVLCRP